MTDVAVPHVMTTPGGTITFNSGALDQYYLNAIPGLGSSTARVPVDEIAFGDGGIIHTGRKSPRYFQPQGTLLILSTTNEQEIVEIRNTMEESLRAAYESLLTATGTWAWTPLGQSGRTLTIRRDAQALEFTHEDNYQTVDFSFGLVCADPDWA